jgi:hypothetical protein
MKLRVIVVGASGMVGKGCLLEALDSDEVEAVLVVVRRSLGMSHPKLKEIIHGDFYNLSAIEPQLKGWNACFYAVGVTSAGMKEADYARLTYEMTAVFAKTLARLNPDMVFCFVSGRHTDATEKGPVMWARVKGKAENVVAAQPFKASYMFRPGVILPRRGVTSRTASYRFFYALFMPLAPVFALFPSFTTTSVKVGQAMIKAATRGYEKKILESEDINALAARP